LNSDAYIKKIVTKTLTSDAYIRTGGVVGSLTSDAWILTETSEDINSNSYIKNIDNTETLTSDAQIKKVPSYTLDSDYYIKKLDNTSTLDSDAYIQKIDNTETINSDAWIKKVYPKTLASDAYIKKLGITKTITSDAYITLPASGSINSDAEINWIGKPVLIYPTDGDTITDDPPLFRWYIPVSKFNVHCRIQVSRNAAFTDIELDESDFNALSGTWEYYTGGSWVAYPAAGISVTQSTTIMARVSFPGITGVKYWRVKGVVR